MKNTITLDSLRVLELSDNDYLQIGATYQQLFWENNGALPTVEAVCEALNQIYPEDKVREYVDSEPFQKKLLVLGLKKDSPVLGLLSPQQVMLANMELSLIDRRSIRMKINEFNEAQKSIGNDTRITVAQYEAWRKDPAYQEYISKRAKAQYETLETEAINNLAKAIAGGDLGATKLLFELKGRLTKNVNVNMNVQSIVMNLIEIVAKHVTDPAVLEAIGNDVEKLELGA